MNEVSRAYVSAANNVLSVSRIASLCWPVLNLFQLLYQYINILNIELLILLNSYCEPGHNTLLTNLITSHTANYITTFSSFSYIIIYSHNSNNI